MKRIPLLSRIRQVLSKPKAPADELPENQKLAAPFADYDLEPKRSIYNYIPFTIDYQFSKIKQQFQSAIQVRRSADRNRTRIICREILGKLENINDDQMTPHQRERKTFLTRHTLWLLADLSLEAGNLVEARDGLKQGAALKPPQTSEEYDWLGKRFLKLGHKFLGKDQRAEARVCFHTAEQFKPSLDELANRELIKEGVEQHRTDSRMLHKYFQYLPPEEWVGGQLGPLFYQGCRIDPREPESEETIRERMRCNRRLLSLHPTLGWAHKNLAFGNYLTGHYRQALEGFEIVRNLTEPGDTQEYQTHSFWVAKTSFLCRNYLTCRKALASLSPQQLPEDLRREYQLYLSLSLAHLFFEQEGSCKAEIRIDQLDRHLEMAQEVNPDNPELHYFLGRTRFIRNRRQEAVKELEAAIKADPHNPHYLIKLAEVLPTDSQNRHREQIKQLLRQAHIRLDGQEPEIDAEVMVTLSRLLKEENKPEAADRWYARAQTACPENGLVLLESSWRALASQEFAKAFATAEEIHSSSDTVIREKSFILGRCALRLNSPDSQAAAWLQKAIDLGMDEWEPYYWLGLAWAHEQDYSQAKTFLYRSLGKNRPQSLRTLVQLGKIHLLADEVEQALPIFAKALEKAFEEEDGDTAAQQYHREALYRIGCAAEKLGDQALARQALEEFLTVDADHLGAAWRLACLHEAAGEIEQCERRLRQIITRKLPQEDQARVYIGQAYAKLGILLCQRKPPHLDEAKDLFSQANQWGCANDQVPFYLGLIDLHQERYEDGIRKWQILHDNHPHDPALAENLEQAYYLWGKDLFSKGDYQGALACFDKAASLNLTDWRAEASFRWGVELFKHQQWDQGRKSFELAANLKPKEVNYQLALGICEMSANPGKIEKALARFALIIQQDPDHLPAHFLEVLCHYLQEKGDKETILNIFRELLSFPNLATPWCEVIKIILTMEDMKEGDRPALEQVLQYLKVPGNIAKLPFDRAHFNRLLACCLVRAYDQKSVEIMEDLAGQGENHHLAYARALVQGVKGSPGKAAQFFQSLDQEYFQKPPVAEEYAAILCHLACQEIGKRQAGKALEYLERARKALADK
ncbi:tetratricopeptide repeat protein [Desulfobacca acetoxidans]